MSFIGFVLLKLALIFAINARCLLSLLCEQSATLGAGFGDGSGIADKTAVRVIAASVKDTLLFTHPLDKLIAALWTFYANLYLVCLGKLAVRIAAAG